MSSARGERILKNVTNQCSFSSFLTAPITRNRNDLQTVLFPTRSSATTENYLLFCSFCHYHAHALVSTLVFSVSWSIEKTRYVEIHAQFTAPHARFYHLHDVDEEWHRHVRYNADNLFCRNIKKAHIHDCAVLTVPSFFCRHLILIVLIFVMTSLPKS